MRILELDTTTDPDFKERLVLEDRGDYISVFSEYYQEYDWKPHGWYNSPDEGASFPKSALSAVIEALQAANNKT